MNRSDFHFAPAPALTSTPHPYQTSTYLPLSTLDTSYPHNIIPISTTSNETFAEVAEAVVLARWWRLRRKWWELG